MAAPSTALEVEWELCNDDGFVYKRRKRSQQEQRPSSAAAGAPAAEDEAGLRSRRREHKRRFLATLRERYEREIAQWERLSSTLQEIEERAESHRGHHKRREEQLLQRPEEAAVGGAEAEAAAPDLGSACVAVVDELLLQAEAQDAIIRDMSNLCDVAEAMCEAEEERLLQPLLDLPVWSSPRSLMAALCDQDFCNNDDNALQVT